MGLLQELIWFLYQWSCLGLLADPTNLTLALSKKQYVSQKHNILVLDTAHIASTCLLERYCVSLPAACLLHGLKYI